MARKLKTGVIPVSIGTLQLRHVRWPDVLSSVCIVFLCCIAWAPTTTLATDVRADPAIARLETLKDSIRVDYPNVAHQTIDSYRSSNKEVLLVDVRAADEFALSHIPGAQHIENRQTLLQLAQEDTSRQLVLYCSVGVRSSIAAQWLQEQGVHNVTNLEGSIFEWYNRGLPLENASGPIDEVHGFDDYWGSRYLTGRDRVKE